MGVTPFPAGAPAAGAPAPEEAQGAAGFWDGAQLGYPQAFVAVMTALTLGLLFHAQVGYRAAVPFEAVAAGAALHATGMVALGRGGRANPAVRWLAGVPLAVTVILAVAVLAAVGGFVPASEFQRRFGAESIFSSWPFRMLLVLLQTNLLASVGRRCVPLTLRNVVFLLSHAGLALTIFGGALSGASLERVRLLLPYGQARAAGESADGRPVTLPFSLTLRRFELDSFPPTLALATRDDRAPDGLRTAPGSQFVRAGLTERVGGYTVQVREFHPRAALVGDRWIATPTMGTAAPAAKVAVFRDGSDDARPVAEGWVSCGSVDTAGSLLTLPGGAEAAVVMPKPRPREYRAALNVGAGEAGDAKLLRVNHPLSAPGGWRLYLLSYDENMGAASEWAVVEGVRDRGIGAVYAGMFLLLAGVLLMLWEGVAQEEAKP